MSIKFIGELMTESPADFESECSTPRGFNVPIHRMASAPPSISQDASSLRAAALLTLKSKTRPRYQLPSHGDRPDDASSVASTRRAAPSPELNYGSEDGIADVEGSMEEEMDGEKEEGEISDDDAGTAVKASTLMDVDDGPLPGLTSSSMNVTDVGNTSGLQHRSHKSPPASLHHTVLKPTTLSISSNFDSAISVSADSSNGGLNQLSMVPTALSTAVQPILSSVPASARSLEGSPTTKLPTPPPRISSVPSQPSSSIPLNLTSSRYITPPGRRDVDLRESVPTAHTERSRANRHASPPMFSRQITSPPVDDAHVRPSLNSGLFV